MSDPPDPGARPSSLLRRLVMAGLVLLALGGFVFAFTIGDDETTPDGHGRRHREPVPAPDSQVLSQSSVEVDLAPGWTGVLQINGIEIPADQLNCVDDCDRPLVLARRDDRPGRRDLRVPSRRGPPEPGLLRARRRQGDRGAADRPGGGHGHLLAVRPRRGTRAGRPRGPSR